jgi:hypothetical protein
MPKPPVTRLCVIEGDCNGKFKIVVEDEKLFEKTYHEWYDHPSTTMWCIESYIAYFKQKYPNKMCVTYDAFESVTKGKFIPATKAEWEAENN